MNMIGSLTTSIAGTSLRLPPPKSTSKMFSGKPSFHAVLEANPVVDRTARTPESLYEVLRIERNATPIEIKTAYRSLAKVYHPDACEFKQNGGDREFIEIHNAYATLSDPDARAVYDRKWSPGLRRKSGLCTAAGGFYTCRRWETDQCW